MVGWKVQPYVSVSTLRTTYVPEPPEAMLRESKIPFEVVPWGTRALLRQKIRSLRYTFSAAGVELASHDDEHLSLRRRIFTS